MNKITGNDLKLGQICLVETDCSLFRSVGFHSCIAVCSRESKADHHGEALLTMLAIKEKAGEQFVRCWDQEYLPNANHLFLASRFTVTLLDVDVFLGGECLYRTWEELDVATSKD